MKWLQVTLVFVELSFLYNGRIVQIVELQTHFIIPVHHQMHHHGRTRFTDLDLIQDIHKVKEAPLT